MSNKLYDLEIAVFRESYINEQLVEYWWTIPVLTLPTTTGYWTFATLHMTRVPVSVNSLINRILDFKWQADVDLDEKFKVILLGTPDKRSTELFIVDNIDEYKLTDDQRTVVDYYEVLMDFWYNNKGWKDAGKTEKGYGCYTRDGKRVITFKTYVEEESDQISADRAERENPYEDRGRDDPMNY